MLEFIEKLVADYALVVCRLTGNVWDGGNGLSFKVKELFLLRIEEELMFELQFFLLLLDSLGLFSSLLVNMRKNFIKLMKRATNLIVKARTTKGAETTDHYSMMGFTKAYNTAKKTCG